MSTRPKKQPGKQRLDPETRKISILEEAINLFAEKGLDASTLDLGARLSVHQSLMYSYFKSKEDLINQVYEQLFSIGVYFPEWHKALGDETQSPRERIIQFYARWIGSHSDAQSVRLVSWAVLQRPELIIPYEKEMHRRVVPTIAALLSTIVAGQPSQPGEAERYARAAQVFHEMMQFIRISRYHLDLDIGDIRERIEFRLDLLLTGLASAPAQDSHE